MKIITKKKQKEIDAMTRKKLRFVARATLQSIRGIILTKDDYNTAMDRAEQVFYADDVI